MKINFRAGVAFCATLLILGISSVVLAKKAVILRDTLEILTSFGDGGRQPGQSYAVHSIAADSKGNIYTTETYRGQLVQKFVYKGLAAVAKKDQGVVWPRL